MSTNNLKMLPALLFIGGLVAACGGDDVGNDDHTAPDLPDVIPQEGTQISIQNTSLPIIETFDGIDTAMFFSPDYKALATPASNEILDADDNPYTLVDPWPSFYYPTNGGYFDTDLETGEIIYATPAEIDRFQFRVQDGRLGIANTRFSIGQILSDLVPQGNPEPKRNSTGSAVGASLLLGSWGELDLFSAPYRVSFCLVDFGQSGSGNSNLELWVDNNEGGNSDRSIHAVASRLLRTAITGGETVVAGNRLVVDVPGDAYMVNNEGERVGPTLGITQPLDGISLPVGTLSSFLQLRVSSGGYVVIDDFIIERQTENNAEGLLCEADPDYWEDEEIPIENLPDIEQRELLGIAGTSFAGLPLMVDASAGEVEFFAQANGPDDPGTTSGNYLAISDNQFDNFYKEYASGSRIFVEEGNNAIRFGNALWTLGLKDGAAYDNCADLGGYVDNAGCEGGVPNGDIDLTQNYRITADILELPTSIGYRLQVQIDNPTGTGSNSVHGTASRVMNITQFDGLDETGELIVNVPGSITLNGTEIGTVAEHIGTATSFIAFRCPSDCGDAEETEPVGSGVYTGGMVLGDIVVEYQ